MMKDRIKSVMEYARETQQDFAARLQISPASLSSIFTGRTNPTNNHVMAVHRAFPEININWLMFGEGSMLVNGINADAVLKGGSPNDSNLDGAEYSTEYDSVAGGVGENGRGESSLLPATGAGKPFLSSPQLRAEEGARRDVYPGSRSAKEISNSMINIDKKTRKIKEIRVFFDDGTYETFVPSSK